MYYTDAKSTRVFDLFYTCRNFSGNFPVQYFDGVPIWKKEKARMHVTFLYHLRTCLNKV